MSIIDKALSTVGLKRESQITPTASGILSSMGFNTGNKVDAKRALQAYNGWTYAAVRAISEEIAKIEFKLYRKTKDGIEEITDHELLSLLRAMNPHQTCFEVLFTTGSHLEMAGNSYWLLDGVESEGDKPKNIYTISPGDMKVMRAKLPEFIKGYQYTTNGVMTEYKPFQILHLKYPDPNDPYEGIGTTQAIAQWIDNDNSATNVNSGYFKNGARLSGILKADAALSEAQLKMMHTSFEKLYKGEDKQYKVGVLPKGVSYEELSTSPKDMDFANLSESLKSKILSAYRVPKTILGGSESETNRATAEVARVVFLDQVIKPKMEMITQYLNEFLVPLYEEDIYLDFSNPVTDDKLQMLEEVKTGLAGQASMSINEVRQKYFSLPPIEGGDEVMGAFNLTPIGAPKKEVKSVNRETLKIVQPSAKVKGNFQKRKNMATEISERLTKGLQEIALKRAKNLNSFKDMSEEDMAIVYKAFFNRVTPYEKKMKEAVRKVNKEQLPYVLDVVKSSEKSKAVKDIFDFETYVALLSDLATPILLDLFQKEGNSASEIVGAPPLEISKEVRASIDKSISLMSNSYNDETLRLLNDIITTSQQEGWPLNKLTEEIQSIYELSDGYRAERLAKTETFRVANDATKTAWKESGVVKTIKWYTAEDERTCEYCGPLHGKVIGIEENYFDKGTEVTGSNGGKLPLDYDNVGNPPLHVNCRCYIRPEDVSIN